MDLSNCVAKTSDGSQIATISCLPIIVQNLLFWALFFAGIVALFLIIFGGIQFLTSGGEKEKVEKARKTITWALIGLIVIFFSFAIVRLVGDLTGVTCINKPFDFSNCGLPAAGK